jgi:hypothetical protein
MNSPSRNPLLLEQNNDDTSSDDDSTQEGPGTIYEAPSSRQEVRDDFRRSSSTPTDHYNFAYIVFYILGM